MIALPVGMSFTHTGTLQWGCGHRMERGARTGEEAHQDPLWSTVIVFIPVLTIAIVNPWVKISSVNDSELWPSTIFKLRHQLVVPGQ